MTIEVKIIACNTEDYARQVQQLADMLQGGKVVDRPVNQIPLQEIVAFLKEQGYTVAPADMVDEAVVVNPDKKSRRKKAAPVEEAAPEASEEEADEATNDGEPDNLEELKSDVIARCSQLMLDGRRDVVLSLKKQFGRTLSDLPPSRFPEIAAELERILNDGEPDE